MDDATALPPTGLPRNPRRARPARWGRLALALAVLAPLALTGCLAEVGDEEAEALEQDADALAAGAFRVMTYNVRYEQPEDTGSRRWSKRKKSVYERVLDNAPDILGVQEAKRPDGDIDYPADLKAGLTGADKPYAVLDPGGGSPKLVFYKKSRFEIASASPAHGVLKLPNPYNDSTSSCADSADGKKATWVKLRDKKNGKVYFVVNAHLAQGSCPDAREEGAVMIKKAISEHADGLEAIVMGDMNDDPNAVGDDNESTIEKFRVRGRNLTLSADYSGTTTNAKATFNKGWGGSTTDTRRIDYIFYSSGLKHSNADIDRTKNGDGISPSDHYAVLTTLTPK